MSVQSFFKTQQWKSKCGHKQKHVSQGKAEAAARSHEQRFGDKVVPYLCRFCKSWHVGHDGKS